MVLTYLFKLSIVEWTYISIETKVKNATANWGKKDEKNGEKEEGRER